MNRVEKEFMERMEKLEVGNLFAPKTALTVEEKKMMFELLFEIRDFYRNAEERRKK